MPRIVFGSIDELISLALDDKTFRNLLRQMQGVRKERGQGWFQEFTKLRGHMVTHLSRQFFFMPLPPPSDKRQRFLYVVHYQASLGQGAEADSWDIAMVPGNPKMTPKEVQEWVRTAVDGVYGAGFFRDYITEIVPISGTEPIYRRIVEQLKEGAEREEGDPFADPDEGE